MRIGVTADTHSQEIPQQLLKEFQKVDLILHAGDFCDITVYEELSGIAAVKGVRGNMDDAEVVKRFPDKVVIEIGNVRIGMIHGRGSPQKSLEFVGQQFKKDKVQVVVFGHSHTPLNQVIDGVLYFNPGSPTDTVLTPYRSYGLLEVKDGKVSGKIIRIGG